MFLVLERFFYCTDCTITTIKIQFIELLVKAWIQLIFGEERRSSRYLSLRVLLGVGVVHNRMADTKERLALYRESVGRPTGRKKDRLHWNIIAVAAAQQ